MSDNKILADKDAQALKQQNLQKKLKIDPEVRKQNKFNFKHFFLPSTSRSRSAMTSVLGSASLPESQKSLPDSGVPKTGAAVKNSDIKKLISPSKLKESDAIERAAGKDNEVLKTGEKS